MIAYTKHGMERMNQRGVTSEMIDLVLEYGEYIQDKVILNRKIIRGLINRVAKNLKSKLIKLLDKGGLVVVLSDDNTLITTYNCNKKKLFRRR